MYFERKIDSYLDEWLYKKRKSLILLVEIKQCCKTESVLEYKNTNNIVPAYRILTSTIFDMKTDFGRRMDTSGNAILKLQEFKMFLI